MRPLVRFVHLACLALCLWRLALLDNLTAAWLQVTSSRVALPEAPLSFQRVRRALRVWAARQVIFANAAPDADMEKIERDHEPLLHMLMWTGVARVQHQRTPVNFCETIELNDPG